MENSFSKVLAIGNISKKSFIGFTILLSSISILDVLAIGLVPLILIAFEDEKKLPDFIYSSEFYSLENLLIFLVSIFIFKLIFAVYSQQYLVRFISEKQSDLTIRLLSNYLDYSYLNFSKSNPNLFIRNLINSIPLYINQALYPHIRITSEIIIIFTIVAAVFYINWFVPFATLITFLVLGGSFFLFTRGKVNNFGEDMLDAQASMYEISKKSIEGYEEIKTSKLKDFFTNRFKKFAEIFTSSGAKYYGLLIIPRQLMETGFVLVFVVGILLATTTGLNFQDIVPVAGAIAIASIRLIPLIANVMNYINDIRFSSAAVEEIYGELELIKDKKKSGGYFNKKIESIEAKNVDFSYANKDKLLSSINFKVKKGEVIGIVGSSGTGKTTLTRLILGMIQPDNGEIIVNGKDYLDTKIIPSTILTQNNFIFNGTVLENVALGAEKEKISKKKAMEALRLAGLEDFINSLDSKSQTMVGDKGKTFSGGQKQRLAISRVFYSDRDVLVLDEPTGSLDKGNAELVFASLNKLKKDKIIIIVTHDQKLSKLCDKLVSL